MFFAILRITSIFWIIKLLSKILHGYYTTFVFLEFWKKLINLSKSANKWEYFSFFEILKEFLDYWKNMLRWDNVTLVKWPHNALCVLHWKWLQSSKYTFIKRKKLFGENAYLRPNLFLNFKGYLINNIAMSSPWNT